MTPRPQQPQQGRGLSRRMALAVGLLLVAAAIGYLLLKTYQFSGRPGYDFRFVWLAGDLWLDGLNPYGDSYQPIGAQKIDRGNVPIMWVYPPSWWPIATPLGGLGLYAAGVVWNLVNILLAAGSCLLAAAAFARAFPQRTARIAAVWGGHGVFTIFCLVFFLIGVLEATGILFSVGQTTLFAVFGICLMLWARLEDRTFLGAVGLTLVMLKPQIGLPYAVLLLFLDAPARRTVLYAVGLSAVMALPALMVAPTAPLDFVRNLGAYDSFSNDANLPLSMTGIRLVLFELASVDIGNPAATGIALLTVLLLCVGPFSLNRAPDPGQRAWQTLGLATAAIVAVAPLHIYDFVLLALPLPLLLCARWQGLVAAAVGAALVWRSENLADLTRFHDPAVEIFTGSRLATIGAIFLFVAIIDTVRRLNRA